MPSFLIINRHKAGSEAARAASRPAHVAWIETGGEGTLTVLTGAPTQFDEGAREGNFFLVQAPSKEAALAFAAGDPFAKAGLVEQAEVLDLRPPFDPDQITKTLSPRLNQEGG